MQLDYTFERQLELEREAANETWRRECSKALDAFKKAMAETERSLLLK